jgi:hypothetical protein
MELGVLLEKVIITQLVNNLPDFYRNRKFISVFLTASHKIWELLDGLSDYRMLKKDPAV